jgi:hypothetical protein
LLLEKFPLGKGGNLQVAYSQAMEGSERGGRKGKSRKRHYHRILRTWLQTQTLSFIGFELLDKLSNLSKPQFLPLPSGDNYWGCKARYMKSWVQNPGGREDSNMASVPMMVLNADAIAESEDGANLLSLLLFCNL